jgi:hypothetical protein
LVGMQIRKPLLKNHIDFPQKLNYITTL